MSRQRPPEADPTVRLHRTLLRTFIHHARANKVATAVNSGDVVRGAFQPSTPAACDANIVSNERVVVYGTTPFEDCLASGFVRGAFLRRAKLPHPPVNGEPRRREVAGFVHLRQ